MVASTSKRRPSSVEVKRKPLTTLNSKSKVIVKENDRITRMKAARDAYSKLSKERCLKQTRYRFKEASNLVVNENNVETKEDERRHEIANTPERAFVFKPMEASLDMIRNNRIKMPTTGRSSSIVGARSARPRPSLLPLGINVFDSKVSASDQQKVREFVSTRLNTLTTPKKVESPLFAPNSTTGHHSLRSLRSVRFCIDGAIEEQRESGGDEALINQLPSTSSSRKELSGHTSNRKATTGHGDFISLEKPRAKRLQLSFASTISDGSTNDSTENKSEGVSGQGLSSFVQSFTQLFNMREDEWKEVEPIMIDQLIELLQKTKERNGERVDFMSTETSELLPPLPDQIESKTKEVGFYKIKRRRQRASNSDLQANQEVMLINEAVRNSHSSRRSLRLRQKDPVSRTLGGYSPFVPIRESPLFHVISRQK